MQAPDLKLLLDAADEAGKIAMKYWGEDPQYWDKGDGQGPVSVADLEINTMLEGTLKSARPEYGWLSEESEDHATRLACRDVFILDPIDGTRSFIAGHENFSHSFAVAQNGVVTAAVVHMPAKQKTFWATKSGGAYLNGEPIKHSGRGGLDGANVLAAKPQMDSQFWPQGVPNVKRHFRSSLAYRLALVACGRFDAMLTFRPAWEWDIAAGDLICREAGALVRTANDLDPVYNTAGAKLPGMIAAAPEVGFGLLQQAKS